MRRLLLLCLLIAGCSKPYQADQGLFGTWHSASSDSDFSLTLYPDRTFRSITNFKFKTLAEQGGMVENTGSWVPMRDSLVFRPSGAQIATPEGAKEAPTVTKKLRRIDEDTIELSDEQQTIVYKRSEG